MENKSYSPKGTDMSEGEIYLNAEEALCVNL